MIRRGVLQPFFFLTLFIFLQALTSCEKFSGSQTVPSYLKIDSIGFSATYSTQGSSSHSIPDAWVYVDGELIGAFTMPADVPVLKEGPHTVEIMPGIKKDGIAATRMTYPYYEPIEKTINLKGGEHTFTGSIASTYTAETDFLWFEDFENSSVSLDTTTRSSVGIGKTLPGSDLTFERAHSGIITMDTTGAFFECMSHQSFTIPHNQVFLELDFRTNYVLTVGLLIYTGSLKYQTTVLDLADTHDKWKKIYIDLSNGLNAYPGATMFQVVFGCYYTGNGNPAAQILLDNIKLLTINSGKKL